MARLSKSDMVLFNDHHTARAQYHPLKRCAKRMKELNLELPSSYPWIARNAPAQSTLDPTCLPHFALNYMVDASFTTLRLTEHEPSQPVALPSNNSPINLTFSRPLGRHNLRFSLIDMKLNVKQRSSGVVWIRVEDQARG
jgi:hypothetical protein